MRPKIHPTPLRARSLMLLSLGMLLVSCTSSDELEAEFKGFHPKGLSTCVEEELGCGDIANESWSCAIACEKGPGETLLPIRHEAGFYNVSRWNTNTTSRIFYSFQHANENPETKPLFVLTNGGPIVSTTGNLLVTNTGIKTIFDNFGPSNLNTVPVRDNPDSWTSFANLLYIDAPGGGYSYDVPVPGPYRGPFTDAAAVVSTLLRFIETHPQIKNVPIVLVGESYGGARIDFMMQMLLHPDRLKTPTYFLQDSNSQPIYVTDTALASRIENHVQDALGVAPSQQTPQIRAQHFIGMIFIQPAMPDREGQDDSEESLGYTNDGAQLWQSVGDTTLNAVWADLDQDVIVDPETMSEILRVDLSDIEWFYSDHRAGVHRGATTYSNCTVNESAMADVFGALPPVNSNIGYQYDCFYLRKSKRSSFDLRAWDLDDWLFFDNLLYVKAFMTSALEDRQIVTLPNVFPTVLQAHPAVSTVTVSTADAQHERPGYLNIEMVPHASYNNLSSPVTKLVRFPQYQAGHMVSMGKPAEFASDISQWLCEEFENCGGLEPTSPCSEPVQNFTIQASASPVENIGFRLIDRQCTVSNLSTMAGTTQIVLDCPGSYWKTLDIQLSSPTTLPIQVGQTVRQRFAMHNSFWISNAMSLHDSATGELLLAWSLGSKIPTPTQSGPLSFPGDMMEPFQLYSDTFSCPWQEESGCFKKQRAALRVVDMLLDEHTFMSGTKGMFAGYEFSVQEADNYEELACSDIPPKWFNLFIVKK